MWWWWCEDDDEEEEDVEGDDDDDDDDEEEEEGDYYDDDYDVDDEDGDEEGDDDDEGNDDWWWWWGWCDEDDVMMMIDDWRWRQRRRQPGRLGHVYWNILISAHIHGLAQNRINPSISSVVWSFQLEQLESMRMKVLSQFAFRVQCAWRRHRNRRRQRAAIIIQSGEEWFLWGFIFNVLGIFCSLFLWFSARWQCVNNGNISALCYFSLVLNNYFLFAEKIQ